MQGLSRLVHGDGYPETWIFQDEKEFHALERIISPKTKNQKLKAIIKQGLRPSCISIDGGQTQKANIPPDWPSATFTPDTAYVLYLFRVDREGGRMGRQPGRVLQKN